MKSVFVLACVVVVALAQKSIFDLDDEVQTLKTAINEESIAPLISKSIDDAMSANAQFTQMAKDMSDLELRLVGQIAALESRSKIIHSKFAMADDLERVANNLETSVAESIATMKSGNDQAMKDLTTATEKSISDSATESALLVTNMGKFVNKSLDGTGALFDALKLTHFANKQIPVWRRCIFDTHSSQTSWVDENADSGYGGVNPSTWTDGNAVAWNMHSDVKYLQRLFTERGTGSTFGATICSIVFFMHSSTTGKVCGALFRIRNTKSSAVTWQPALTMTSFTGWAETASITVNGQGTWSSNCAYECRFSQSISIPANGAQNRMSTVIFISTSSQPYGYNGWNERTSVLLFRDNALALPDGLEYVDDLDSMTGNWKV